MKLRNRLYLFWLRKRRKPIKATKIIAIVFLCIILMGAFLLTLPISTRSKTGCDFLSALFTATSATCVTGLSLFDTWSQWSGFGQIVILALIQIGGLGFMSIASILVFLMGKQIGLKQRLVMAQAFSLNDIDGVVRLQKNVLIGSFSIEGIGALVLFLRFLPRFGFKNALKWGIFHSISAFCNAGFDIFGVLEPGSSVGYFADDAIVLLTLGILVVVGGLGFLVWSELASKKTLRKLSIYVRIVLITTATLLLIGWGTTCALEWNNPDTLGNMSTFHKLVNGLFQSITLRTAGFAAIDQGRLTEAAKAVSIFLMLIGGSSGSTAGGLKTVTFTVLVLFLISRARGRSNVRVFRRTIPQEQVLDAMTIGSIMVGLAFLGAGILCVENSFAFTDALYETVSAIATVGLTTGLTSSMGVVSKWIIILYMYFGRIGVLTISLGFLSGNQAEDRVKYAETKLLIG